MQSKSVTFVSQAEIKRLQEANKAARRERQLLLKQQEEIERMRHSTLRLKERLKKSGDANLVSSVKNRVLLLCMCIYLDLKNTYLSCC